MDSIVLSVLLGAIVLLVVYLVNLYSYFRKHGIPCLKGTIPLLGHMLPLLSLRQDLIEMGNKIYEDFPDASMVGFYRLARPVLLIRDLQLVKTVLESNFTTFGVNALRPNKIMDPLISKSTNFQTGETWLAARKHFRNAFTGLPLQIFFQTVDGVAKKYVDFLERKLGASNKCEVELTYLSAKYTMEIALNGGFGIEGHCFEHEGESWVFHDMYETLAKLAMPSFSNAVKESLALDAPGLNNILQMEFIPKNVDTFFRTFVREVVKNRESAAVTRNDFFQLILQDEMIKGEKFDEGNLAGRALSFFLEAIIPTRAAISIAAYHIASNPDVQKKVREEVLSVISKYGGTLTYQSLKEMTYMDQVISESQRHHHNIGHSLKLCTQECELRGSDGLHIRVKPGTMIHVPVQALHMDPKYWVNPETFDPERFNTDRKQDIEKLAFLPFGVGPRACPGMRVALLELKVCLATILKSYSIELSPKTKLPFRLSSTAFGAFPDGGVWVYVKRI